MSAVGSPETAMVSPTAARVCYGAEMRRRLGTTKQAEVVRRAGGRLDQTAVSRILSGSERKPLGALLAVRDVLVPRDDPRYDDYYDIARLTEQKSWPEFAPYKDTMGPRQKIAADLEIGAEISGYYNSLIPGLLQTDQYAAHRAKVYQAHGAQLDIAGWLEGQSRRRQLFFDSGRKHSFILEPQVIWRVADTPAELVHLQLMHLHHIATTFRNISIRVLPIQVTQRLHETPREPFDIYQYPDPIGTSIVAIDGLNDVDIMSDPTTVQRYRLLYSGLSHRDVALSEGASAVEIRRAADELAAMTTKELETS